MGAARPCYRDTDPTSILPLLNSEFGNKKPYKKVWGDYGFGSAHPKVYHFVFGDGVVRAMNPSVLVSSVLGPLSDAADGVQVDIPNTLKGLPIRETPNMTFLEGSPISFTRFQT